MNLEYFYINALGRKKSIVVNTEKQEKGYFSTIWDCRTGDLCSSGWNPKSDLKKFFDHFNIEEKYFDEIFVD